MPGSQTVYMYFLSLGLWRVKVYHQWALQQIHTVYHNDQKLRLLITESEHWLSLSPQILTNRFSEELLTDGRCVLSSKASNTDVQWSWTNCPLFQKTKILRWNSNSEASPGQGRWPGTIQDPKGSEGAVTLPSSLRSYQLPVLYYLWILTFLLLPQRKKP